MRQAQTFFHGQTTDGTSNVLSRPGNVWNYQASISGSGAVSATVTVEVSNDGNNWLTFGTMSLSGTNSDTDNVAGDAPWAVHRVTIASLTGTSAAVTVIANGVEA